MNSLELNKEIALSGKYATYPEYKDSGSKWLDEIPEHWKVTSLKHVLSTPITDGPHLTPTKHDKGIPFISAEAISQGYINFDKRWGYISKENDELFSHKYRPQRHDVYMIKSGATTGVTAIVETDARFNIWSPLAVMRCKSTYNPYFLLNYLRSDSFQKSVQLSWTFGTQQNIGMNTLENLTVCYPPIEEQTQIANFLGHETAKIDTLIDKQQQLIKLLKEKRQAVISHAVTKGLNPDAAMKDSGVEWLGEVPEHWEVISLKHLVSAPIIDGPHLTPTKHDEGVPFISAESVSQGYINFEKKWGYISKEDHEIFSKRYCPQLGDILMVKLGATTGVVAMVETDEAFNVWVPLATIRAKPEIPSKFVFYLLQSSNVNDAIQQSWTYGTQQTLGLGTLSNLSLPVPPQKECEQIIQLIESKVPLYDESIEKSLESLSLLQERRTALISAAVTGKIDVRDWQAPISVQEVAVETSI